MIALWILLGIIGLFALILWAPIRIALQYTPEEGLQFQLRFAGIGLADSRKEKKPKPEKPKPEPKPKAETPPRKKKKKKSGGGAVGMLMSFLGLKDVSSITNARNALEEKGLQQLCSEVFAVLAGMFRKLGWVLGKGVFRRFHLHILVADEDAADAAGRYGQLCATVYPMVGMLSGAMTMKDAVVDIRCDFDAEATQVSFDGVLVHRAWYFVSFLGYLIKRYLKNLLRKEGT